MSQTVRLVAHLSDVHILDRKTTRSARERAALRLLSFARTLDSAGRMLKLRRALEVAKRRGADHFVFSGDLTEVGSLAQFEVFAEVLADAKIAPERVTLVPGNHDLYASSTAWRTALAGPLRPYAAGAAEAPGKVVDRDNVVFVPLDVTRYQSLMRSGGELTSGALAALSRSLLDHPAASRPLVIVVQHHPPFPLGGRAWNWLDGLTGHVALLALLMQRPQLRLLHGHLHASLDRSIGPGASRVFGAPAVVDDREETPRVRLYDVSGGALVPCATGMPAPASDR